MKTLFNILKTIIVLPFALVGGLILGVLLAIVILFKTPAELIITTFCDIWDNEK